MSDEKGPSLAELTARTLALAEAELTDLKAQRDGKALNAKVARTHRKRVLDLVRALPGLLKESRQITKSASSWAETLTYEQKAEVMLGFYRLMPIEHQKAMVQAMTRILNERRSA